MKTVRITHVFEVEVNPLWYAGDVERPIPHDEELARLVKEELVENEAEFILSYKPRTMELKVEVK